VEPKERLGSRIRQLRTDRRITINDLADRVGVSRPTIWSWESGKTLPRSGKIPALSAALGVAENDLILSAKEADERDASKLEEEIARSKTRLAALAGTTPEMVEITIRW
jgi:transcriptional regulator with XRE-family HTH domain